MGLGGEDSLMEKVFIKRLMEITIKAISKMDLSMVRDIKFLLMGIFMKEIILMVYLKGRETTSGKMEAVTREISNKG